MRRNYTSEFKEAVVNRYFCGEKITQISADTGISRSTIYIWINEHNESLKRKHPINMRDYHDLKQKCDRQANIISILKLATCTVHAPLKERYEVIKKLEGQFNVNTLCEAMNVSKGSYYNHIFRNKNENTLAAQRHAALKPVIEEIYNESNQIFGPGKVAAIMKERGYKVSPQTVANIMHENNWFSIRNCAKTLYVRDRARKENILNQEFKVSRPNEVWVSDVTYFRFNNKTYYICVILDLYARKVIAHRISDCNSTQLTKATLKIAYENRMPQQPLLFHSDQGGNYTSKRFMDYVSSLGITQSFSRSGVPYDNSVCESFFSNFKKEELYRHIYKSVNDMKKSVSSYMNFYNQNRPHTILRYRTPNKAEDMYFSNHPQNQVNQ